MSVGPEAAQTNPFVERLDAHLRERAATRAPRRPHTAADRERWDGQIERDRPRLPDGIVSAIRQGRIAPGDVEAVLSAAAVVGAQPRWQGRP